MQPQAAPEKTAARKNNWLPTASLMLAIISLCPVLLFATTPAWDNNGIGLSLVDDLWLLTCILLGGFIFSLAGVIMGSIALTKTNRARLVRRQIFIARLAIFLGWIGLFFNVYSVGQAILWFRAIKDSGLTIVH
jgi:hypothetical protein